jgi:hypothetical protein
MGSLTFFWVAGATFTVSTALLIVGFIAALRAGLIGRDDAWKTPPARGWFVSAFVMLGFAALLLAGFLFFP